jgi:beta-glucosidase
MNRIRDEDCETADLRIGEILGQACLAEKVAMMSGEGFFEQFRTSAKRWGAHPYRAGGGIERLGIAPFFFTDGPRGVARGHSTCFPCSMARGASFDVDLEHRIGEAMGIEARAQGCNLSGAVCVNLLRHPAWGRGQETYGEDQHHLGEMGTALALGIQTHNVAATVKHFALNSMENSRFRVDVSVDDRALHEVYLPHFKRIVDAGVLTVMSAYNKVNGSHCGENRELLTAILRDEWGFAGFVHSDWIHGVYSVDGATAGLDVENPEPLVFGEKLLVAVRDGRIPESVIDTACRRILRVWLAITEATDPQAYDPGMVAQSSHRALALEAAEKSAVLLANDGVLPLDPGKLQTIAVLGRLAALENTGDYGSSRVQPPYVVTPLKGIESFLLARGVRVITGVESDLTRCSAAADAADAVIVVAGYTADEEGEYIPGDISLGQENASAGAAEAQASLASPLTSRGGDRASLELPADQLAMINAAAMTGKPVIVVIVAGSAVLVENWHHKVSAILQTFYAGMEGGNALARLLFGEVSPSGRLPFSVATDATHYPYFDRDADAITYGYWHGYAKLAHECITPRYAFGHGLSYTSFSRQYLTVNRDRDLIVVEVDVRNDGAVAADEVVQCYVGFPGTISPRARFSLKGFARVTLQPGESRRVSMTIALDSLTYRDTLSRGWKLEPGPYRIMIMNSASDPVPLEATVEL